MTGYTSVVQYANTVIVTNYERKIKLALPIKYKKGKTPRRSKFPRARLPHNVRLLRKNFFMLVEHNLHTKGTDFLFMTFTFAYDISLQNAYRALSDYFSRSRKRTPQLAYIAVSEYQKKGRIHFHVMVWGYPQSDAHDERSKRLHQRLFRRGYIDVRLPRGKHDTGRLAGYMAKYMSKSASDFRTAGKRLYTCSRNIDRPRKAGSNQMAYYAESLVPDDFELTEKAEYNTVYLGAAIKKIYKINKQYGTEIQS